MAEILPFLVLGGVMYALLLYPQQRKNKAHQQLLASLREGDEVLTNSGIYGFIKEIEPDVYWIEVAEGMELRFARNAIQTRITVSERPTDEADQKSSTEKDD